MLPKFNTDKSDTLPKSSSAVDWARWAEAEDDS